MHLSQSFWSLAVPSDCLGTGLRLRTLSREKEEEMKAKRLLSGALALALTFSVSAQALAVQDAPEASNPFPYEYGSEDGAFNLSKISHPQTPANTRHPGGKNADGLVDYLGNGKIGLDKGQGDRGQSYCWGALAYGDWMYVNTLVSSRIFLSSALFRRKVAESTF